MSTRYDKILNDYDKHCQRIAQSTSIRINESPADKARRMKSLEADYIKWFEYYFPNYAKKKCAWFHRKLAKEIIKNRHIRALAEWYRSAAKSVHIDMGIPLFLYLAMNDMKYMLLIGETEPKAKKLLSSLQAQLQYNQRIINDYGHRFKFGDWADGDFTTTDGVKFTSLGFGQSPRGAREGENRPDYIVVDDVDNKRHVNNDKLMREAIEFITEDVWGCFDSDEDCTDRFIYANNNFHKNSITNRLRLLFLQGIQQAAQDGDTSHYYILKVCAVKNLNTFEPEWPEKNNAEYWRKNSTPRLTVLSCANTCTCIYKTVQYSNTKTSFGVKCSHLVSTTPCASMVTFPTRRQATTKPCYWLAKQAVNITSFMFISVVAPAPNAPNGCTISMKIRNSTVTTYPTSSKASLRWMNS